MKLTTNISLEELIHPGIYQVWGSSSINWVHCDAPRAIQQLRDKFGEIKINDWKWGGNYINSGVRMPSGDVGAPLSSHKGGFGFDLKFMKAHTDDVLAHILDNQDIYPHISRIENIEFTRSSHGSLGHDWLHIEITHNREGDIHVFRP